MKTRFCLQFLLTLLVKNSVCKKCKQIIYKLIYFAYTGSILEVNNPASFSPSFRPLRARLSSVHGAELFPGFNYASPCKAPLLVFLPYRFPKLSLESQQNHRVSLRLSSPRRSPFLRSFTVAPVGQAPRSVVPPFNTVLLFPGIYRKRRPSTVSIFLPSYKIHSTPA